MRTIVNSSVAAMALGLSLMAAGCVKAPRASQTPTPFLGPQDCCAPPAATGDTVIDLFFDPMSDRKAGPAAIATGQTVRVVVINVNPLVFDYGIESSRALRVEADPGDFFKWWLGALPQFSPLPELAVTSTTHPGPQPLSSSTCDPLVSRGNSLKDYDNLIKSAFDQLRSATAVRADRLDGMRRVLTNASTRGAPWRLEIMRADTLTAAAHRHAVETVNHVRDPIREFKGTADDLVTQAEEEKCAADVRQYLTALKQRATQHEGRLVSLLAERDSMRVLNDRYHGLATDSSSQYRLLTLDVEGKPSDITVTVSRRRLEPDAKWQEVRRHPFNVGGDGLMHINGGFVIAYPIQSSDYGTVERSVFDPQTGMNENKHVIVAKSEQTWRVVPFFTLSTNLAHVGNLSRTFFSAGAGVKTDGKPNIEYFLGGGYWFSDRLAFQAGAYIGERRRLGRGQALGDFTAQGGVTVDRSLGTSFGVGVSYRLR